MHQNPQGLSCASTWHGVVQAGTTWHRPSLEDSAVFTVPSSTQIARKSIQALQVLPPPPYISFLPHLPSTDSYINDSFLLVSSIYDWSRMEALAGWPSPIPALFPPHPCLPRRPLCTSHPSVCSPPSRRHSIPMAISTICAVTRQLLPLRNESYGVAFPLIAPLALTLCTSLSL